MGISFKQYLREMHLLEARGGTANTVLSDINEIQVGYILNSNKWYSEEAKAAFEQRAQQARPEEVADAIGKAQVMAVEFVNWAKSNGYSGTVKQVWWTARPGELARASHSDADSKKNPTDILVLFTGGPANGYLGLSAKATKGKGEIGFKNPGLGTIDRVLGLSLATEFNTVVAQTVADFDLPKSATVRKQYIRDNADVKKQTESIGVQVLATMRDKLFARLQQMPAKDLLQHLLGSWMDAEVMYPPYVKVTGHGVRQPYSASVMDPVKNEKLDALAQYPVVLERVGNESIGVKAGTKKIMKMRFKFESEKMASSVKMSGEAW